MSLRGVVGAFAVLCGVEASLILPTVSSAQLAETAATTAINGHLRSVPGANGIRAVGKARSAAAAANQQRRDDEAAWNPSVPQGQTQQGTRSAQMSTEFSEKSAVKGRTYTVEGNIVSDDAVNGHRVILVMKVQPGNQFLILGFRPKDLNLPKFANNAPVRVTAVFAAKVKDVKTGTNIYGFDNAVFDQGQTGANPNQAGLNPATPNPEAEKLSFDTVLKGWVYRGMVQVEGKATGVFVNEERVKYAQPGTQLDEGVKVNKVGDEMATVTVDGKKVEVAPW